MGIVSQEHGSEFSARLLPLIHIQCYSEGDYSSSTSLGTPLLTGTAHEENGVGTMSTAELLHARGTGLMPVLGEGLHAGEETKAVSTLII